MVNRTFTIKENEETVNHKNNSCLRKQNTIYWVYSNSEIDGAKPPTA